ncbi:hypothetical protein Tco_0928634 [Tanacetum coccineum]
MIKNGGNGSFRVVFPLVRLVSSLQGFNSSGIRFLNFFNDPRIIWEQRIAALWEVKEAMGSVVRHLYKLLHEVLRLWKELWRSGGEEIGMKMENKSNRRRGLDDVGVFRLKEGFLLRVLIPREVVSRGITSYGYRLEIVSSGFVSAILGQMTYSVASLAFDSTRTYDMLMASSNVLEARARSAQFSNVSLMALRYLEITSIYRSTIKFFFHFLISVRGSNTWGDKASSVKVPVANVTLSSSAHLLRENTDSFPLFATGISLGSVFLLVVIVLQEYQGLNSSDGGNIGDRVKIAGEAIGSGDKIDENTGGIILSVKFSEELKELLPDEAGKESDETKV